MVKPVWLAVVLGAGIVIGIFVGREMGAPPASQVATAPMAVAPATPVSSSTSTFTAAPAAPAPTRPASPAGAAPAHNVPATGTVAATSPEAGGEVQPIDVGPVFSKQFADTAAQGYRDAMAEAHHAMEREVRDDSWAYPLEAEIENSLVPDTSMGNFKKEHVECRASMCEVRLTARGAEQAAALQRWNDGLRSQPWSPQLFMSSSSVSNNDDNVDALLIFTKPPASTPTPPPKKK